MTTTEQPRPDGTGQPGRLRQASPRRGARIVVCLRRRWHLRLVLRLWGLAAHDCSFAVTGRICSWE